MEYVASPAWVGIGGLMENGRWCRYGQSWAAGTWKPQSHPSASDKSRGEIKDRSKCLGRPSLFDRPGGMIGGMAKVELNQTFAKPRK